MNANLMREVLRKRKARKFDTKSFLNDEEEEEIDEKSPTPGLGSPDLEEKKTVEMGGGVKEEVLEKQSRSSSGSTDDLSPSKKEMESKGVEMEKDEKVFDEDMYEKLKKKDGKLSIYEKMQMKLGKKLRGE